ncbi:MAG TPA: 5'-nucleotidase [Edaphocola sp.]|nr:5'-nucleotidase [Edaphocola sp.]
MIHRYLLFLIFGLVLGGCAHKPYVITQYQPSFISIKDSITKEEKVVEFLMPYKKSMDSVMDVVIGKSEVPLSKSQPESTMGNFAADAQLEAAKKLDNLVTISVVNYGGLRIPFVPKGNITKGKIYEIMPFDNMLTVIEIPGEVLRQFCNHMAAWKGWPVSGISYVIEDGKATEIKIDGKPLKENQTYRLVTSDYIAHGGDDCDFLIRLKQYPYSVFLRDALIEKVKRDSKDGKGLHPQIENRISYAK